MSSHSDIRVPPRDVDQPNERSRGQRAATCAVVAALAAVLLIAWIAPRSAVAKTGTVRLALVNVPDDLLRPLLPEFQKAWSAGGEILCGIPVSLSKGIVFTIVSVRTSTMASALPRSSETKSL